MKKFIIALLTLLLVWSCRETVSNYTYFYRDTVSPQELVDSLLGSRTSDFTNWPSFQVRGIRYDSTDIVTYLNWIEDTDSTAVSVTVTCYSNTDTCTVKRKLVKLD